MAIRPTDLQSALIVSTQAPPLQQRQEQGSLASQAAQQAAFVAKTDERNERVAETGDTQGNKIGVKEREQPINRAAKDASASASRATRSKKLLKTLPASRTEPRT